MMLSRTLLKGAAIGREQPSEVLREVNSLLHDDNEALMFVTVLYAVYDPVTGEFIYSSGGHDSPLVVHADGSSTLLPTTGGVALGIVPDFAFGQQTVTITPGDTVVLYTDGVTEAMSSSGEQFGIERLQQVFAGSPPVDSREASRAIFDAVSSFAGGDSAVRRHDVPDSATQGAGQLSLRHSFKIETDPGQLDRIAAVVKENGDQPL